MKIQVLDHRLLSLGEDIYVFEINAPISYSFNPLCDAALQPFLVISVVHCTGKKMLSSFAQLTVLTLLRHVQDF